VTVWSRSLQPDVSGHYRASEPEGMYLQMSESHDIPELTPAERIRVRAMVSDMTEMAAGLRAGTATPEDVEGAVARIMSVDVDRDPMLNALHIPADAGPFAPALETILAPDP
jgi:hypothetical protein